MYRQIGGVTLHCSVSSLCWGGHVFYWWIIVELLLNLYLSADVFAKIGLWTHHQCLIYMKVKEWFRGGISTILYVSFLHICFLHLYPRFPAHCKWVKTWLTEPCHCWRGHSCLVLLLLLEPCSQLSWKKGYLHWNILWIQMTTLLILMHPWGHGVSKRSAVVQTGTWKHWSSLLTSSKDVKHASKEPLSYFFSASYLYSWCLLE